MHNEANLFLGAVGKLQKLTCQLESIVDAYITDSINLDTRETAEKLFLIIAEIIQTEAYRRLSYIKGLMTIMRIKIPDDLNTEGAAPSAVLELLTQQGALFWYRDYKEADYSLIQPERLLEVMKEINEHNVNIKQIFSEETQLSNDNNPIDILVDGFAMRIAEGTEYVEWLAYHVASSALDKDPREDA